MFMWFQRLNLTQLLFAGLEAAGYTMMFTFLSCIFKKSDTTRDLCKMFVSLSVR